MDSSDDELLNEVATEMEQSLLDPDEINPFSDTVTVTAFDSDYLPDAKSLRILFKKFGHKKFRPLQWRIINSILKYKRDNCAVMTTGYGKSLCYQFPAVFSGGITLVISPLISLMEDQVLALTIANIPACLLGTAQKNTSQTVDEIFESKYSVVYLTPEFCTGDFGLDLMKRMQAELQITLIAVDEAHCVSSWGHDFRHSYRNLGILKDAFPTVPILAVTATATENVKRDIVKVLKLKRPQILCSGFDRPNLYLAAKPKSSNILNDLKSLMVRRDGRWVFDGPTIIYCIKRKDTEVISSLLKFHEIPCLPYHAGLSLSCRKEAHEQFVKDKISVIVATIAFGMGIDKPDIRNVIHYGSSGSLESYYQEVGRAGRDGLPSKCVAFYSSQDFVTLSFLIDQSGNSKRRSELLNLIKEYLFSHRCRREFILSYFEGRPGLSLPHRNDCCDNCAEKDKKVDNDMYEGVDDKGSYDFTDDAVKYLSAVDAMGGTFGNGVYILFLKGSKSSKIRERDRRHSCYGTGSDKSDDWWKAIANYLEVNKYLKKVRKNKGTFTYHVLDISDIGRKFLNQPPSKRKLVDRPTAELLNLLKKKPQRSGWISADGTTPGNGSTTVISAIPSRKDVLPSTDSTKKAETQEQVDDRLRLFRFLKNARSQLAAANDCMPYMIASDFALMELAKYRPCDLEQLQRLQIEGLTEARINKFGEQLLQIIRNNTPQSFYTKPVKSQKSSILEILAKHPIPDVKLIDSANVTYEYFKSVGSSMPIVEVATKRGLAESTVVGHLISILKSGYPIKLEQLGVTPRIRCTIIQVINSLGGQYDLVTPIKMACPDNITYSQIRAVCAYLQVRDHLKQVGIPYEEFEDFKCVDNSSRDEGETELDDNNDDLLSALCEEMERHVDNNEKQDIINDIDRGDESTNKPSTSYSTVRSDSPPPYKKARSDIVILDSPPRESPNKISDKFNCDADITSETNTVITILDSPIRESSKEIPSQSKCTAESVKSETKTKKKLPPWLCKKKVK